MFVRSKCFYLIKKKFLLTDWYTKLCLLGAQNLLPTIICFEPSSVRAIET